MDSPCPQCGSTNYDEEDGILVCENGHYLEGAQQVVDTEQEFGAPRGKVTVRKVDKPKVKVTKVYRGSKAFRLYLQAWQHILWKQCYTIIHDHAGPPELWTVARDLWTVRLSLLTPRFEHIDRQTSTTNPSTDPETDLNNLTNADTSSADADQPTTTRNSSLAQTPTIAETLATLALALTLLHFPLPLSTLHNLALNLQIPYIRAIRALPTVMVQKMPPAYHHALDTTSIPRPENLARVTHRLAQQYTETFGMQFPAINWRLLLKSYVEALALPIEVYAIVKRLREIVGFDFRWEVPADRAGEESDDEMAVPRRQRRRRSPVAWPETQLASLVVVAVKMMFPFNNQDLFPGEDSPQKLRMDWADWLRAKGEYDESVAHQGFEKPKRFLHTTDRDVQGMSDGDLDEYMDWFQQLYTESDQNVVGMAKGREGVVGEVLRMFPLKGVSAEHNVTASQLRDMGQQTKRHQILTVQQNLYVARPDDNSIDEADEGSGGSERSNSKQAATQPELNAGYPVFSSPERLAGEANSAASAFHEQVAQLACLNLQMLLRAVIYAERRLLHWADNKRRDEVFNPLDMPDSDDDSIASEPEYRDLNRAEFL